MPKNVQTTIQLHSFPEKAMAPHSSTLAWKIPWMEKPDRWQSMGSHRVGHDWATSLSLSWTGEGNGHPVQCSCLENPRDGRAWWAAIYRVAQSGHEGSDLAAAAALISHASKVTFNILQARLQQYVNWELSDIQAELTKSRGTRNQTGNICWIIEKARESHRNTYFCFIKYKALTVWITTNCEKFLKEMGVPDHLTCLLRNLYA